MIERALAKAPGDRYPSAGDLGRAALAAAGARPVTGSERTVARGAAAPQRVPVPAGDDGLAAVTQVMHSETRNGGAPTAVTVAAPRTAAAPRGPERTVHQPRETLPLGDQPRKRRRGRRMLALLGVAAVAGAAGYAAVELTGTNAPDPETMPGAPVADGEVASLVRRFSDAYAAEDTAALGKLLTRDAERVVPGARQEGRADVVKAYRNQFAESDTKSFKVDDLKASGGATGRATGRYVATYGGDPDVTGTITFGVLRDRGTPRIALISARQDG